MPDTETPTPPAEGAPAAKPDAPATPPNDEGKAPKWDGEFDADRAARLVENLRADIAKRDADLAALRKQVEEKGGTEKTLQERLDALEKKNADTERALLVAQAVKKHSLPDDLAEFLTAKDADGLEKQAERLAARIAKEAPSEDGLPGKPKPALTPGQGGDNAPPFDPEAVAKSARRR